MILKRTLFVLVSCLFAGYLSPLAALAATGAVTLSGPSEVPVGQTFQITAAVSGAEDTDTVRLNGSFSNGLVELQTMYPVSLKSISPGNFSNQTTGIFSLGSFSVNERLNGRATLAVFVFKAKKTGIATIVLGPDSLILSNGNIQSASFGKVQVKIVEPSQKVQQQEQLVALTSQTHPEGIGWRSLRDVEALLNIVGNHRAYIGFDRFPDGVADVLVTKNDYTFTADVDGVWYIHAGVTFSDGTFVKKSLMVLIDTVSPHAIEPSVEQSDVPADVPNFLHFATLDDTSGVAYYDVHLSSGYSTSTQNTYLDLAPLSLKPGEHEAKVIAYDRAGNSVSGEVRFLTAEPYAAELPEPEPRKAFDWISWLYLIGIISLILALIFFYLGYHRRRRKHHSHPE